MIEPLEGGSKVGGNDRVYLGIGEKACFGVVQSCLGGGRSSTQPEVPNCNVGWSSKTTSWKHLLPLEKCDVLDMSEVGR